MVARVKHETLFSNRPTMRSGSGGWIWYVHASGAMYFGGNEIAVATRA